VVLALNGEESPGLVFVLVGRERVGIGGGGSVRRFGVLVVVLASVAVAGASVASARRNPYPKDAVLRVNQMQVLGTHNSYHLRPARQLLPQEPADYTHPALDVQLTQGIRSLDIDVQNGPTFPVYHSIIVDQASNCPTFEACLSTVEMWSRANPGHAPLMLFVELKELPTNPNPTVQQVINEFEVKNQLTAWDAGALDRLDSIVRRVFKKDLVTPDEVRAKHATLRAAITRSGWPTLARTRGRVLVVFNSGVRRGAYLAGHPSLQGRAMFIIAPNAALPSAAFVSVAVPNETQIQTLLRENMIVRTEADADAVEARANDLSRANTAIHSGAQVIVTDYPVPDPSIGPYTVRLPTTAVARCNPITAPRTCRDRDIENAAGLHKP
jgi:Phosphoinositide phospholipase C, Ca2+-dependent